MNKPENKTTYLIEPPEAPEVTCITCLTRVPKHKSWKITITHMEDFPSSPHWVKLTQNPGALWHESESVVSPGLSATASYRPGPRVPPRPTKLIHTYTGYACSREHAEQGAEAGPSA